MKNNSEIKALINFIWNAIKPYKWHYALMLQAPILSAFYSFANHYSLKLIVDVFTSTPQPEYETLGYPIALFISAQILLDLIWRVSNVAEWKCEPYVRRSILLQTYDRIQHYPYSFFLDTQVGTITSKIKGILDGYDNLFSQLHHRITAKVANSAILIAVLAIISTELFAFMAIWSILFSLVMYKMSLKLDQLKFQETEIKHKILGQLSDNITNIFSLFSFSSRKYELQAAHTILSEEFVPRQIKSYKYDFKLAIIGSIFYWIMLISVFLFMIYLRKTNKVTTGDFVFVMGITLTMSQFLWEMVIESQSFMRQIGDFKSSLAILSISYPSTDKPNSRELIVKEGKIQFKDIQFAYDKKIVFEKLNITIQAGEKVGLVGLSGAGKSSLISILLKNYSIQSGDILIDDQSIYGLSSNSIRKNIALIPQDILLFHRSIMENIHYGRLDASTEEIFQAAQMANIHHFIESLPEKYNSFTGERGVKLSGGQRQKIAIARAILKKAQILILDEATSNLDTESEREIQQSIELLLQNNPSTVIAIAHRLSTLKHMDRIIVLDQGKIIEEGQHETLIHRNQSLYKKLWEMQKI